LFFVAALANSEKYAKKAQGTFINDVATFFSSPPCHPHHAKLPFYSHLESNYHKYVNHLPNLQPLGV
jgi:hypothetical protein